MQRAPRHKRARLSWREEGEQRNDSRLDGTQQEAVISVSWSHLWRTAVQIERDALCNGSNAFIAPWNIWASVFEGELLLATDGIHPSTFCTRQLLGWESRGSDGSLFSCCWVTQWMSRQFSIAGPHGEKQPFALTLTPTDDFEHLTDAACVFVDRQRKPVSAERT